MADRDLQSRTGKGAALSASDHDQNMNGLNGSVEEVTADTHEFTYVDHGKTIQYNRATAIAVTVPTAASVKAAMDTGVDNFIIRFKNINTGVVTLTSSDNIDGELTLQLAFNEAITLQTNASNDSWSTVSRPTGGLVNSGTNLAAAAATLGEVTNIPTTANMVTVSFSGLSVSGTGIMYINLGDSSYAYDAEPDPNAVYSTTVNSLTSDGRVILTSLGRGAGDVVSGIVTFLRINGTNSWAVSGTAQAFGNDPVYICGVVTTTGVTDRLKVVTSAGAFDAGTASVYWI